MRLTKLDEFLLEQHQYKPATKEHYKDAFLLMSRFTDHPFSLTRKEMNQCLDQMRQCLSDYGFNGYVHDIRRFYKWLNGDEEYPDCVKHIKLKKIQRLDYIVKKIMKEEEVKKMLKAADHPRDRAMIAVCIATGARRGELLNIHLRDLEPHPYGYRIRLTGKTGTHMSPPVDREFAKILNVWLEHHPSRDNPDAPLWVRQKGNTFEAIRATMAHNILKQAAKNAGLQRRIHWHMFRHTENTWATKTKVSRASRNLTHGWSQAGNTAAIYESLTDEDAEREYRKSHGAKDEEIERTEKFGTVKCAYCGEENPSSAKYCNRCYVPLNAKEAEKFVRERNLLDYLLREDVFPKLKKFIDSQPEMLEKEK